MNAPQVARLSGSMKSLVRRIDALSLRERVFLFASLALLSVATLDHWLIAPSLQAQAGWNTHLQRESAALAGLRAELAGYNAQTQPVAAGDMAPGGAQDSATAPLLALQRALTQARAQQAALLSASAPGSAAEATRLDELLRLALAKHPGVSLMRLDSDAPQGTASTAPQLTPAASAPEAAASVPGIPTALALQMGLIKPAALQAGADAPRPGGTRLAVAGRFADLQNLLQHLESNLPGLRWGALSLDASGALPMLTLQLWLPGSQP